MTSPLLIVGSMAFDDLELPSGFFPDVVGGSATYAGIAASLFTSVRLVAVVGSDFPTAWLDRLKGRGVDVLGVQVAEGSTFRWKGRYASNLSSRTTLDTQLNVFANFQPILPAPYRDTTRVLLGNIHPALQSDVLDQLPKADFVALDTMNYWIESERPLLEKVLSRIDLLLINDEEARLLGQEHNLARAAERIHKLGPRNLIIKRGDAGALLFDPQGVFFAPALPLTEERDPTGAGDTFAGALLGTLAREDTISPRALRRSLWRAAATASFCVQGVGPGRLAEVDLEEVSQRAIAVEQLCRVD